MACRSYAVQVLLLLMPALVFVILCSSTTSANAARKPVYPYWSMFFDPATYDEQFQLRSTDAIFGGDGGLAPEWDESNSTYYMRLAENAATYNLTYFTYEHRPFVSQSDNVIFINAETGRPLAWRQEGDEYFLVEGGLGSSDFQFLRVPDIPLACPFILGARCEAYSLVSHSTSEGLSAYNEDGVVYFKKASGDLASFVLLRVSGGLKNARATSQYLSTSTV